MWALIPLLVFWAVWFADTISCLSCFTGLTVSALTDCAVTHIKLKPNSTEAAPMANLRMEKR